MNRDLVGKLTIDKLGIKLYDTYHNHLTDSDHILLQYEDNILLNEVLIENDKYDNGLYSPDYYAIGFFEKNPYYGESKFIISTSGTHIMYVTGIPRANVFNYKSIDEYRKGTSYILKGSIFHSYWEDNKMGYFTQIQNIIV